MQLLIIELGRLYFPTFPLFTSPDIPSAPLRILKNANESRLSVLQEKRDEAVFLLLLLLHIERIDLILNDCFPMQIGGLLYEESAVAGSEERELLGRLVPLRWGTENQELGGHSIDDTVAAEVIGSSGGGITMKLEIGTPRFWSDAGRESNGWE